MQIPGKLFYNSKGLTEQNAQDKIVFMILRYGDETLKIVEAFAEHDFVF